MAGVEIQTLEESGERFRFTVTVSEGGSSTRHEVALLRADHQRLAGGEGPSEFVARCFEFLLERESKESILSSFDVSVIGQYFPEFEKEIKR